ncbi:hypothetical protein ACJX0J_041931, partial [Zea mays]
NDNELIRFAGEEIILEHKEDDLDEREEKGKAYEHGDDMRDLSRGRGLSYRLPKKRKLAEILISDVMPKHFLEILCARK